MNIGLILGLFVVPSVMSLRLHSEGPKKHKDKKDKKGVKDQNLQKLEKNGPEGPELEHIGDDFKPNIPCTYISLAKRSDRRELLVPELDRAGLNCQYTEAVDAAQLNVRGTEGCRQSHLKALKQFNQSGVPYALILEDDAMWKPENFQYVKEYLGRLEEGLKNHPVILLSCNGGSKEIPGEPWLHTIHACFTTSAYVIRRDYMPKLIEHWEAINPDTEFLDVTWFKLQSGDNWAVTAPRLVKQRASYSDIEHRNVDYGVFAETPNNPDIHTLSDAKTHRPDLFISED